MIYRKRERPKIILDENKCPRCRYVAAIELLNTKTRLDNFGYAAVKAYEIEKTMKESGHTFGLNCNASKDYPF